MIREKIFQNCLLSARFSSSSSFLILNKGSYYKGNNKYNYQFSLLKKSFGITQFHTKSIIMSSSSSSMNNPQQQQQAITQPKWHKPQNVSGLTPLKVYNSMTRNKEEFIPIKGKSVGWYCCGPTVYDASHMGHARAYITFDILRRIMEDYFGFNVLYVMNITDIDDKIILAARYKYLFENYKNSNEKLTNFVLKDVQQATEIFVKSKFGGYQETVVTEWDSFKNQVESGKFEKPADDLKFDMNFKIAIKAFDALKSAKINDSAETLLLNARDVLAPFLDAKEGDSCTDPVLFRDFAAYWEEAYFKDMDDLNIKRPDVLTRVSEYVEEIVSYVQKIIYNGYGYESDGSVYFDTVKFDQDPNHSYAKLEPWSAGNVKLLQEGEGDLSKDVSGKKNKSDFALWKKSKPGQPAWPSPWGLGRPGWHIECSAMASEILGDQLDIHSGGIDLAFPHHDNELAQAEAHFDCHQWVNYFIHAGHLHIEGQKMSKSLKNFVTIQEALEKYTANQIRLMFLLHQWDSVLDFKEASMNEAKEFEQRLLNFFVNVKSHLRANKETFTGRHNFNEKEKELLKILQTKEASIHKALCDSFNTPQALTDIRDLISAANTYMSDKLKASSPLNMQLLVKIAQYVTKMMNTFGVGVSDSQQQIGWSAAQTGVVSGANVEDIALPYLQILSEYRDTIRSLAQSNAAPFEYLDLSDKVRDEDLVDLGVALDDQPDGKALIKFVEKSILIQQREEKKAKEEQKSKEKEERLKLESQKKLEKLEKGKLPPSDMFKTEEAKNLYSQWDENGMPTHSVEGEELPKSRRKKLQKEYDAQAKLHNEYLAHVNSQQ